MTQVKRTILLLFSCLFLNLQILNTCIAQEESTSDASPPAIAAEASDQASSSSEKQEPELDLGLRNIIESENLSDHWGKSVDSLLSRYDLTSSTQGRFIASGVSILVFAILFFILKKIMAKLISKAKYTSQWVRISTKRSNLYLSVINYALFISMLCLFFMALAGIWSNDAQSSFIYQKASALFQFIATFTFLFILGAVVYEVISSLIERFFRRWSANESARIQTLLPIARSVVNVALFILLGITVISELGINIMPLLAGAGVIGFAVGFGAQTIIKDLITGFIIILEDLVQVGDVATVGGKSGLIEKITIRKIQLRSLDGVVFTVPFSEIAIVENMTKDYSYYLMDVGIAYRESPDEVIELLKKIGAELQEDEDFKGLILDPIEILGVDAFADSAIIIKARIKTLPIKQWQVGREFNRRMKYRFDEAGIEIPFPHQTIYFGEDKDGKAPPANLRLLQAKDSANDSEDFVKSTKEADHKAKAVGFKEDADEDGDS